MNIIRAGAIRPALLDSAAKKQDKKTRHTWYNWAMKQELMDMLACPVCKGELELTVEEENEQEVATGSLYCSRCQVHYPIVDSIPNLLPPNLRG
jgi:uncharacterized protein YbaR (Trm112 family)